MIPLAVRHVADGVWRNYQESRSVSRTQQILPTDYTLTGTRLEISHAQRKQRALLGGAFQFTDFNVYEME